MPLCGKGLGKGSWSGIHIVLAIQQFLLKRKTQSSRSAKLIKTLECKVRETAKHFTGRYENLEPCCAFSPPDGQSECEQYRSRSCYVCMCHVSGITLAQG